MARVWYVGDYPYREITPQDWDKVGMFGPHHQWSVDNGWSVDESLFRDEHLVYLQSDPEFLTGKTGPRPDTPAPEDGVTRPYRVDASILAMVDDAMLALAAANDALDDVDQSKAAAADSATAADNAKAAAEAARDVAIANGLVWRGAYAAATQYVVRDVVTYGGSSWRALKSAKGVTPVEGASWSLLAAKGDTGPASYSAMSQAEANDGTDSTPRVMTPVILKAAILKFSRAQEIQDATGDISAANKGKLVRIHPTWGKLFSYTADDDVTDSKEIVHKSWVDGRVNSMEPKAWVGTQAQYNALPTKDPNRAYDIVEG